MNDASSETVSRNLQIRHADNLQIQKRGTIQPFRSKQSLIQTASSRFARNSVPIRPAQAVSFETGIQSGRLQPFRSKQSSNSTSSSLFVRNQLLQAMRCQANRQMPDARAPTQNSTSQSGKPNEAWRTSKCRMPGLQHTNSTSLGSLEPSRSKLFPNPTGSSRFVRNGPPT